MSGRSLLLSIPLELRLQIYKFALQLAAGDRRISTKYACSYDTSTSKGLPLLHVCQTITYEVAPVLYGTTTFHLTDPVDAMDWFELIGPTNLGYVKCLSISIGAADLQCQSTRPSWLQVLGRLKRGTRLLWLHVHFELYEHVPNSGAEKSLLLILSQFRNLPSLKLSGSNTRLWPECLEEHWAWR